MGVRLGGLSEGANKRYTGRGKRDNGGVETRDDGWVWQGLSEKGKVSAFRTRADVTTSTKY